jgi:predicted membrane chloride channel (bestrophin family)
MTFRTNSCYDRWWEGRKLWDAITHKCLDMGRVSQAWVAPKDPSAASEMVRLTIGFSVVAKKYLRQNWKVRQAAEQAAGCPYVRGAPRCFQTPWPMCAGP